MKTLLVAFALALVLTGAAQADTLVIRAGGVIDPATGAVTRDQTLIIENGLIRAIGKALPEPAGARVVDLSKEWLMPGLMDAHTHLTLTELGGDGPFESFYLAESTAFRSLRGLRNAQVLLTAGFTTVRDIGNDGDYAMVDVRRAIDKGLFDGPTIVASGKIVTPFGGQSHGIPPERGAFWSYEYLDADTPDEIRKAVRRDIYYGAGVIKLVGDNNAYHYTADDFRIAADEAHKAGLPVAVHVYGGEAAQAAIDGGVDSIEHGFWLTDAQLVQMKAKGIFLVGTDFPRAHLDVIGTSGGIFPPPEVLAPRIVDRLQRARKVGVRMVFGSDTVMEQAGRTRADLMFDYLAVWRSAGVTPTETLKAMTSDAADLLRVQRERGRIQPGLAADLVAMPLNPLENTEALRQIDFVMKNGKVIRGPAP